MEKNDGLVFAWRLDGQGGGDELGWPELRGAHPSTAAVWVHLDCDSEAAREWLTRESGLDPLVCEALLAEETRPRSVASSDGLLVILRGVNLNPGADPEDMVSVRMWVESGRLVSLQRRRVMAIEDVRGDLAAGRGAGRAAELLVQIGYALVERMAGVLGELDDRLDLVEEGEFGREAHVQRTLLAEVRRQAIALRRYLSPQRDALSRLQGERITWLEEADRLHLHEVADRTTRYVEDLEAARERAAVTQEEIASRLSEQLNRRMYTLSVIAGVFLPLSFVTGLLGINVAGIPGAEAPMGFGVVSLLLGGLAAFEIVLFRWLRWF
jgi:zinc transporter